MAVQKIEIKDEKVTTVCHPNAKDLSFDIFKTHHNGYVCYYYKYSKNSESDYYSSDWCNNPLEACKAEALKDLKSMYNGSFYETDKGSLSEKQTFSAMQS